MRATIPPANVLNAPKVPILGRPVVFGPPSGSDGPVAGYPMGKEQRYLPSDLQETPSPDSKMKALRWAKGGAITGLLIVVVILLLAATRVGDWLVVQDPLQPASAIVVLGGQVPFRAMEAAAIYRQGWAHEVWLTQRVVHPEDIALKRLGISALTEDTYSEQVLERLGVPAGAIRRLDERVQNTADEVRLIDNEMRRISGSRVIIVTSKVHTRRVKVIWKMLNRGGPIAIVRFATSDPSDPDHWWHDTGNAMAVSREVFGLLNAWAGFPMRSSQ